MAMACRTSGNLVLSTLASSLLLCACLNPVAERHPGRRDGGGGIGDGGGGPCLSSCDGRQCGDDGCGGSCGACPSGQQCGPATFQCLCADPDAEFCQRSAAACGELRGLDLCGLERVAQCGSCGAGRECQAHACVVVDQPETDTELCGETHVECGPLDAQDRTGAQRHVDECGPCAPDMDCADHACVCRGESDAELCAQESAECGELAAIDRCGAARTAQCGACDAGLACRAGACVNGDVPETDAQLCARKDVQCGPLDAADNTGQPRHVDECGVCAPGTACDEATGHCGPCTPESDDVFCAHQHLCGASASAMDNCGLPRTVATCPACPSGEVCQAGHCVATSAPSNDTCAGAELLTYSWSGGLQVGTAVISGTTSGASDDTMGSCGFSGGRDVVYSLPLSSDTRVYVEITPTGTAFRPTLYLRRGDCAHPIEEEGCSLRSGAGRIFLGPLEVSQGSYFLWVDGKTRAEWGPFSLYVRIEPSYSPNDTCAYPLPLQFNDGAAALEHGLLRDDYSGSCGGSGGPDAVYSFSLGTPSRVALATSDLVYVRSACASTSPADELACFASPAASSTVRRILDLLAGTYYVFVDCNPSSGNPTCTPGNASILVGSAPANDTCASATPIALDANGHGTIDYDTRLATADYGASCRSSPSSQPSSPDLVFSVDVPPGKKVQVATVASHGAGRPIIALRYPTCDPGPEVACGTWNSSTGSATATSSSCCATRGTVYIIVSDESRVGDTGTITATLQDP